MALDTNSSAIAAQPRKHVFCSARVRPPGIALLRACLTASELFLKEILQRIVLVGKFCIHFLVLRQLGLRFFQAP